MSLRERKRRTAMRRIQEAALDLFDERGFGAVTIEQIADAADVSASSVYRYFGTKEQLILHEELDLDFFDLLGRELASHPPVEAVKRALSVVMTRFFGRDEDLARRKIRYWMEEPAIQPAAAALSDQMAQMVGAALAEAVERRPDDLDVQVIATTLIWAMNTAVRHWYASGYAEPLEQELARALTLVENGLRLEASSG